MNSKGMMVKCTGGFIIALISNAVFSIAPLAVLCFVLVLIDCFTAWRLSVRLKRQGRSRGKFRSDKFGVAVLEMAITIPTALLVAHFVQLYIFEGSNVHLPQIVAGVIGFWQIWSILENVSSGNRGAAWAKVLQKVMIDKAERHLDVDLSDMKKPKK